MALEKQWGAAWNGSSENAGSADAGQ